MTLFQPNKESLAHARRGARRPVGPVLSVCCLLVASVVGCGNHEPSTVRLGNEPAADVESNDRVPLGTGQPDRIALDAAAAAASLNVRALRYELTGHTGAIEDLAFSPDSRYAASCSGDRTVRVWDLESGVQVQQFSGHLSRIDCVAFSPDGRRLVSGSLDNSMRLWDLETGTMIQVRENLSERINVIAFTPDGKQVMAAGIDGSVRWWDVGTDKESMLLHPLRGLREARKFAFTPDGKHAFFSRLSSTGDFYSWELAPRQTANLFARQSGEVRGLATTHDGRFVAASYDDRIDVFNVAEQALVHTLYGHDGPANHLAFSPDGRLLASVGDDKTVILWNPATGEIVRRFTGHTGMLREVAFSPDGRTVMSGGLDKVIRVWNVPPESEMADQLAVSLDDVLTIGPAIARRGSSESAVANVRSAAPTRSTTAAALAAAGSGTFGVEQVKATFEKARQVHTTGESYIGEFRDLLKSIANTFPTVDVTVGNPRRLIDGKVAPPLPIENDDARKRWQTVTINTEGGGMGAVRFTSPLNGPADMYWAFVPPSSQFNWYITPAKGSMNGFTSYMYEPYLDLEGVPLSDNNVVYFQSLEGGEILPGGEYYLWFATYNDEPTEIQLSITLVPSGGPPGGTLPTEIAEMMGIPLPFRRKTGTYKFVTPEEARSRYQFVSVDGLPVLSEKNDPNAPMFSGRIVSGLAYSPSDGNWIAGNLPQRAALGTAALLDVARRGEPELFPGHDGVVSSVAASSDGRFLATAASDGAVILRDAATHEVLRTLRHDWPVHDVAFSPDNSVLLAACGEYERGGIIALWDPATGEFQGVFVGHGDAVRSMSFSADGSLLVTTAGIAPDFSQRGEVVVWDFRERRSKSLYFPYWRGVYSACISADGRHLAVAGQTAEDPTDAGDFRLMIRFLDTATGEGDEYVYAHSLAIQAMQFVDNDRALLSAGADGFVRLWKSDEPESFTHVRHVASWHLHEEPIVGMALSDDAAQVASIDAAGNVQVVDLKPEPPGSQVKLDLLHHRFATGVIRLGFTPDTKRLFVGANEWGLARWNLGDAITGEGLATWVPQQNLRDADLSSDGRKAVLCLTDPAEVAATLILFDMAAGGVPHPLTEPGIVANCARFSPDGKYMASGDSNGEIVLWDVEAAKPVPNGRLHGHRRSVKVLAMSPNGSMLASGDQSGNVSIWQLGGGPGRLSRPPQQREVVGARGPVAWLEFSSDGERLVVESDDVRIVDVKTGKEIASFPGRGPRAGLPGQHAALSPDGKLIAVAGGEGAENEVRIYNTETGEQTLRIRNIDAEDVGAIVFSPSGKRLLTGGRLVQCWDVETGRPVANFAGL